METAIMIGQKPIPASVIINKIKIKEGIRLIILIRLIKTISVFLK
jgi:hypothetical protein